MASVVHVTQPTDGGVAKFVHDLAEAEVAGGWSVTVVSPPAPSFVDGLAAAGARHVAWRAVRRPGLAVAREAAELSRVLAHCHADLVHLHSSKSGLDGRLALRGRRPTLFQPHAWSFAALPDRLVAAGAAWERFAARWADVVLCVSDAERARGIANGIHADLRVVANGVDLGRFVAVGAEGRAAARLNAGLPESPVALCVGRICRQKGQDTLIDVWPAVRERVPGACLVLVGDGPDAKRLQQVAGSGVRFAGPVTDVVPWLAAADIVIVPSRWEGMSLSLLEAMASGSCIVASDVDGTRDALGTAGAIVAPGNTRDLQDAVVRRLLDADLRAVEGRAARARAQQAHDSRVQLARVMELSAELAGRRGRSTRTRRAPGPTTSPSPPARCGDQSDEHGTAPS